MQVDGKGHVSVPARRADRKVPGPPGGGQGFSFWWRRFLDGCDLQHAAVERDVRQQAIPGAGVDRGQPCIQQRAASFDEAVEVGFDRDRQRAGLLHGKQGVLGDQPFLEGAVLPATADPDLACGQPHAQLGQDAGLVVAPIDLAAEKHVAYPGCRTKAFGADLGRRADPLRFASHSTSMARRSEAVAGTPSNTKASRKAGDQRRAAA